MFRQTAGDDGRQPSAKVLNVTGVGAAEPKPGLLYRVIRLAERAQDPIRNCAQPRPVLLKPFRKPIVFIHPAVLVAPCIWYTRETCMV
jgi:hypothetical protein